MKNKKRLFLSLIILSLVLLLFVSCDIFTRPNKTEHICSYDDVQVISPLGCTTDGIIMRSCFCGRETTEITPATGHTLGDWSTVVEANCSTPGKEERRCSVCGYVQSHTVARTEHSYEISDEIIDGKKYNRYTCHSCSESFLLEEGFAPPETDGATYLTDKSREYSFIVICAEGEEYLKEHLKIINYYFIDSDRESVAEVDYTITNIGGFKWLISPTDSYDMGQTYIAMRTEGVYFEEYGFSDLVFTVVNEKKDNISIIDDIIYVGALEKESPGYYPYSIEYSTGSGEYFISLEKADGLAVDDYICIGSATCFEDVVDRHMTATFGKITSIAALDDGRMLIMLREMTLDELFTELDLYSSSIEHTESLTLPINVADRFKAELMKDEDFANYLSLIYTTADEYLASRGLTLNLKDFDEFIGSLTVSAEQLGTEGLLFKEGKEPTELTVNLKMDISIPALYEFWSVGTLGATVELRVTVGITDSGIYITEDGFSAENSTAFISFDMDKTLESTFELNVWSNIEYFFNQNIIVLETSSEEYHFKGCKKLIEVGRENIDNLTVSEFYKKIIADDGLLECEHCRPISDICENMYLLDTADLIVHTPLCDDVDMKDERMLIFSERSLDDLLEDEYTLCQCHSERGTGAFSTLLIEKTRLGEFGEYAEEIISDAELKEITVGAFSISHSGIDREFIIVKTTIDFKIEESASYSYTITENSTIGFRSTLEGLRSFEIEGDSTIKTEGLVPSDEILSIVNADCAIILYIAGFTPDMAG